MEKSYPQALDTSDRRVSPWWVFAQKSAQWRHPLGLQEAHKAGHEARRTAQTTISNICSFRQTRTAQGPGWGEVVKLLRPP